MSTKQLGILLALALVLGAAVKFWRSQNSAGWSGSGRSAGQELLGTFQVNDVAQVVISRGADKVTLVKTPDRWVVKERGDFAADFTGKFSCSPRACAMSRRISRPVSAGSASIPWWARRGASA